MEPGLIDEKMSTSRKGKQFRSLIVARFWMIVFLLVVFGPIILLLWLATA